MAKRKDNVSFSFSSRKIEPKKPVDPPAETPAESAPEAPAETPAADPFAATEPAADPFASSPTESTPDPFASTPTDTPDPFASTPAESPDPFASTPPDSSPDPFASTPTESSPDPFASTPAAESPAAEEPAAEAPAEKPTAKPQPSGPIPRQHNQFRILILADFSGRTNRSLCQPADISSRKVRNVDADNLAKVMTALKPEIQLPLDEKTVIPLAFKAMEDFRPDSLIAQIQAFQGMLNLRNQLKDPKKFKDAAAAVRKLTGAAAPAAKAAGKAAASGGQSDFEALLDRPIAPKNATNANADAMIANLVAGYGVESADPEQAKLVGLIEDALSAGLRAVLRHPAFQAVEGAWRGVEFLVSRLSTDDDLKLCILDLSKDELYADLSGPPTIQKTGMYQVLVEQTRSAGAIPFSLVIGDYDFDQTPANIALLAKIATLMHEANIPFVAAATPKVPGYASFDKAPDSGKWQPPADLALWEKIRGHKLAAHIGLAAPRFLVRMPFGPKTDAIDAYPFNEIPDAPVAEQYLWINGAYAVALLIGQAFLDNGWDGLDDLGNDVSDLPCHMAIVDGDKEMTPCAEGWLSDRVSDILFQLGLIPLLSVRNAASIKVAGIHSIAKGKALAASWAQGS